MLDRAKSYFKGKAIAGTELSRLVVLPQPQDDLAESIAGFVREAQLRTVEFTLPLGAEDMADFVSVTLKARWMKRAWHRFFNDTPNLGFSYASVAVIPHSQSEYRLWHETDAEAGSPGVSICGFHEGGGTTDFKDALAGLVAGLQRDFYWDGGVRPEIINPFHQAAIPVEDGVMVRDLALKQVASFLEIRRATSDLHNISFAVAHW